MAVAGLLLGSGPVEAGQLQSAYPSTTAVALTPQLVASTGAPQPHVDAVAELGGTVYAAGLFDTVADRSGTTWSRGNVVAFDKASGGLSATFHPQLAGGQVWAVATDPATGSVYLAGSFTTVDGVARAGLAKLDGTTGALDPGFRPPFRAGRVNDLALVTVGGARRLIVGGGASAKLFSLNPATGANDGYFASKLADPLPGAWGGLAVYRIAVDPTGTRLVATGNFTTVDGQPRSRFVMMDLGAGHATVDPWYYPGFAKPCSSTAPRRIAYLQGVDWSPDGSFFDVTATGQIPRYRADVWYRRLGSANLPDTTVCDAVGRFALADPTRPVWINYTGGDSVWTVSDTGSSVYVAGHFRWLDNPDGYASIGVGDKKDLTPAVMRKGIGAVDPLSGLANAWDPGLTNTKLGGKALLAAVDGLWVGNDATQFHHVAHYGLAFAPLVP